jgi:hypothetical protein
LAASRRMLLGSDRMVTEECGHRFQHVSGGSTLRQSSARRSSIFAREPPFRFWPRLCEKSGAGGRAARRRRACSSGSSALARRHAARTWRGSSPPGSAGRRARGQAAPLHRPGPGYATSPAAIRFRRSQQPPCASSCDRCSRRQAATVEALKAASPSSPPRDISQCDSAASSAAVMLGSWMPGVRTRTAPASKPCGLRKISGETWMVCATPSPSLGAMAR